MSDVLKISLQRVEAHFLPWDIHQYTAHPRGDALFWFKFGKSDAKSDAVRKRWFPNYLNEKKWGCYEKSTLRFSDAQRQGPVPQRPAHSLPYLLRMPCLRSKLPCSFSVLWSSKILPDVPEGNERKYVLTSIFVLPVKQVFQCHECFCGRTRQETTRTAK